VYGADDNQQRAEYTHKTTEDEMSAKRWKRREVLAVPILAAGCGGLAQAQSAGERLVRREVLNRRFKATEPLVLYKEPKRVPLLPLLWWDAERSGETIAAGEIVRVSQVMESSLGLRRFVWVRVETKSGAQSDVRNEVVGWLRLGGQHGAMSRFREQLERISDTSAR